MSAPDCYILSGRSANTADRRRRRLGFSCEKERLPDGLPFVKKAWTLVERPEEVRAELDVPVANADV